MIAISNSTSSSSFLTTGQAANLLGLSIPTVRSLVSDGSLRSYLTKGDHHRLDSRSVHAYLLGEEDSDETALEQQERLVAILWPLVDLHTFSLS
jgi:excisionase family DNA binding protein